MTIQDGKTKIKKHFEEHKQLYFGLGIGLGIAGITALIVRDLNAPNCLANRTPELLSESGGHQASVPFKSFNFFSRNSGNLVSTIHNGDRGHPGFMTKHLETGVVYPSQKAAADAIGIPQSLVSSHLNGKFDTAGGHHFERVAPQ